jgi:hypothetical protein
MALFGALFNAKAAHRAGFHAFAFVHHAEHAILIVAEADKQGL